MLVEVADDAAHISLYQQGRIGITSINNHLDPRCSPTQQICVETRTDTQHHQSLLVIDQRCNLTNQAPVPEFIERWTQPMGQLPSSTEHGDE